LSALSSGVEVGVICALVAVFLIVVGCIFGVHLWRKRSTGKWVGATLKERPIFITDSFGELTEIIRHVDKGSGMAEIVRFNKSFTARLIQAYDGTKYRYTQLKNKLLDYVRVTSEVGWKDEIFYVKKKPFAKFDVVDGVLFVYLPIDASKCSYQKPVMEHIKDGAFAYRYCVKDDADVVIATDLIDGVAKSLSLKKGDRVYVDYYMPFQHCESLVEKGLATEYVTRQNYAEFLAQKGLTQTFKLPNGDYLCPEKFEFIDCRKV
jgi:hypothetical protein